MIWITDMKRQARIRYIQKYVTQFRRKIGHMKLECVTNFLMYDIIAQNARHWNKFTQFLNTANKKKIINKTTKKGNKFYIFKRFLNIDQEVFNNQMMNGKI